MNIFKNIALTAIFVGTTFDSATGEQAWSYRGIPYPTDNVPGAVMPVLPAGADKPGWPYDPCTIANPTFTGAANQYYVDTVNGNNATAGNGGRGSVELPRQTVPGMSGETWIFTEGMQVFITGNSTLWGAQTDRVVRVRGTANNPCWIVGVGPGQPNFGGDKFFLNGQHLLIDNVRFVATDGKTRIKVGGGAGNTGSMDYFTLRNSTVTGIGTAGSGENAAIGGNGSISDSSSFVMFYRNTISNFGKWDRADANGVDRHGIQPTGYTSHWWIVGNEIFHMEGDSVQVNTSGSTQGIYAQRPHYIYIAGNEMYENYEQSVDNKNCFHVIISENQIYNLRNQYKPANSVAFILTNDGEGWLSGYQWGIYNSIDNVGTGFKIAATAASILDLTVSPPVQVAGEKTYVVGNVITNSTGGIYFDARSTSPDGTNPPVKTWVGEVWAVDNSIHVSGTGIYQNRISQSAGEFATYTVSGNLIYRQSAGDDITMSNSGLELNTINVRRNLGYSPAGAVTFTSKGGAYDSKVGNLESTNPLLIDVPNNMGLGVGSPAIDANEESPVYQLFEKMYGIKIAPKMTGSSYDLGAYEAPASGGDRPAAPTNLRAIRVK
jgi:hypothetical protein